MLDRLPSELIIYHVFPNLDLQDIYQVIQTCHAAHDAFKLCIKSLKMRKGIWWATRNKEYELVGRHIANGVRITVDLVDMVIAGGSVQMLHIFERVGHPANYYAILIAADNECMEMTRYLLDYYENYSPQSRVLNQALIYATKRRNVELMKLLVGAGADVYYNYGEAVSLSGVLDYSPGWSPNAPPIQPRPEMDDVMRYVLSIM